MIRLFDLLGDSKKSEEDALRFAQEVVIKLDVNPRDGKISKGKFILMSGEILILLLA